MAALRKRGSVWYFRFVDADGVKRERKGCPDKRATEEMARDAENHAAKVKSGLVDPRDIAFRDADRKPLAAHLDDWQRNMEAQGRTVKHARQFRYRAEKVCTLSGAKRLSNLAPTSIQAALKAMNDAGLSLQTATHSRS